MLCVCAWIHPTDRPTRPRGGANSPPFFLFLSSFSSFFFSSFLLFLFFSFSFLFLLYLFFPLQIHPSPFSPPPLLLLSYIMSEFADAKTVEKVVPQTSSVKSFLSGGFGGIASVLVGHPFDLAKVTILILNSYSTMPQLILCKQSKDKLDWTQKQQHIHMEVTNNTPTRLEANLKGRANLKLESVFASLISKKQQSTSGWR